MSKTLRTAGMIVAAVAIIAATAGTAAPAVAATATTAASAGGVAGISAATLTAIGTYGTLAAGVLSVGAAITAPGITTQGNPTTFTTNPQSGLPYAIGRTRMSGLRIYARTSNTPGYTKAEDLLWFGALLSIGGPIDSMEKFTADNEQVAFLSNGNAVGRFNNWMSQKLHLGGPQASGIALTLNGGSPPDWTAAHRLSGATHAMWGLRFDKDGKLYGAGAPEPAWVGKWVKVYDPRKDSTYPGGSGSHRALNESTYEWSDNPGLHALTWALGRWQNGKRTCGIGAPIANIRIADFVEMANVCDANAWKVGGVEWTTDTKWVTFKRILQAGGAVPTQTGAMIGCLVSTPRTAIATIEGRHLHDGYSFPATKSRRDRFNTVIPRYVDEASDWAVISGKAIQEPAFVTQDKGQRTKEIDFPLVQVFSGQQATQPGQLAAYAIVDSREAGPWTWTTGPEWIGLKTGDVVLLNVPEEGLINQPVLITRREPDPASGKVSFAGQTETHSKHPYALGQTTTPPTPFSLSAPDLTPPAPLTISWSASGTTTGEGLPALVVIGTSEFPSADAVVIDYRIQGTEDWMRSATLSATGQVMHVIAPLASGTFYEVRIGYSVGPIVGNFTTLAAVKTGAGKLSGIEDGATKGAPAGTEINGRPVEEILAELQDALDAGGVNSDNWADLAQLVDTRNQLMLARTTLDGSDIAQVVVDTVSKADNALEKLSLLGVVNADGNAYLMDLGTVLVEPGKSLAQHIQQVAAASGNGAIDAVNSRIDQIILDPDSGIAQQIESVKAQLEGATGLAAQVAFVKSATVDADGGAEAKGMLALQAGNKVVGFYATNNGSIGTIDFVFDGARFLKPDGTLMWGYDEVDNVVYMPNVRVDTLKVGAMTPEFLTNQTITATQGSQMLPGGVVMKWGQYRANINSEVQLSIVFDEPFPNACQAFVPVPYISTFSVYRDLWLQNVGTPTRFGVSVATQSSTENDQFLNGFDWMAFGK